MKAMVIGVSGQDGSYLSELLLDKGYDVLGVRRRSSSSSLWRLQDCLADSRFKLVEGDITDYSSILNLLDGFKPDEIYNLAAQSHVGTSFSQPGYTWDVTAKGVLNLLESMRFLKSKAKLYQASSSEMFGKSYSTSVSITGKRYNDGDRFQDEITNFDPQSPYAIAKLAAHQTVDLYRQSYGIWACGGILFNHESPRRGTNFVTRKITKWFHDLFSDDGVRNKLQLGNLDSCRDWGYAKEYVEAMWLMLQQDEPRDYVIGTGETHTVKEFLGKVYNYHYHGRKKGKELSELVNIDDSNKRPAEVPFLRADAGLAARELGWKPKTTFNELVELMCREEDGLE